MLGLSMNLTAIVENAMRSREIGPAAANGEYAIDPGGLCFTEVSVTFSDLRRGVLLRGPVLDFVQVGAEFLQA